MRHEVFLARTTPCYDVFPYQDKSANGARSFRYLWEAWGRDPDNPFHNWISKGGIAVIKPNWVKDYNPAHQDISSLVTHGSIIKYVIDWCAAAMQGRGTIIIGDAPLQGCNFSELLQKLKLEEIITDIKGRYPGLTILVEDWRLTVLNNATKSGRLTINSQQSFRESGDSDLQDKYLLVDLAQNSFLEEISEYSKDFRVTMYKPSLMHKHHEPGKHEYLLTKRVFDIDLLINLPKMKTHIKTGITGALKNLVGINGHKEFLPHHIKGSYFEGGDCYCVGNMFTKRADALYDYWWENFMEAPPSKRNILKYFYSGLLKVGKVFGWDGITAGSWSGNETLWRTVLDLNHILYFSKNSPKRVVNLVDGIVAGEGEGPLNPSPKLAGILAGGENPACIDAVLGRLMGYNISRLPLVYHALTHKKSRFNGPDLRDIKITFIDENGNNSLISFDQLPNLHFKKPKNWVRASQSYPV